MSSSLCPLPKNQRGHSPASAAPAHMAGGIAMKVSHHRLLCHTATNAQKIAMPKQAATLIRKCLGLARGPLGRVRYAVRSSSSCGSAMPKKMLPPSLENKGP